MRFKYLYIIILLFSLISIADAAIPNASFTANSTVETVYPMVVGFTDTSVGVPTTWNWSFGDGRWFNTTNAALKNATYQYAVAGKYTVNLTVNNTDGSNITIKTDYINLTSDADSNVTSWLHMNGTNGSTTFTGEEGIAWTSGGGAFISTNQFKFGGASGRFLSSTSSFISTPSSNAFNFSTGDFTIEFWANVTTAATNNLLISKTGGGLAGGWGFFQPSGTASNWAFYMGSTANATPTVSLPINTWNHVVIERQSGTINIYVNGMLNATRTGMGGSFDTGNSVRVGFLGSGTFVYNGFVDEMRISKNLSRWKSNFTTPYNEYRGVLETIFPDINPNSTFRYKTNITDPAPIANQTNGGTRNRTVQIQNITNTSYVVGEITFNPLYVYAKSIQLNLSFFPTGMTLLSSSIDNVNGLIQFNISRPAGFNPGTNRASILDYTALYYNYTDGSDNVTQFFGFGFLINGSTNKVYPIHIFEPVTQIVYEPWNFTASVVANNLTIMNGTPTFFISSFTGAYPNRWNWSFGDGTVDNGLNSSVSHTYNIAGPKTINLTEYLWQNLSVSNTTIKTNYIEVQDPAPIVNFTSNVTSGINPVAVQFTDDSTGIITNWNWSFKNVTGNSTQVWFNNTQNPEYVFGIGNWSIVLNVSNPNGGVNSSDGNYYINVSPVPIPIVDFSANDTEGSTPLVVQFTDNSLGTVTNWNWSFRNVTGNNTQVWFNITQNPLHTFGIGNFSINLNASNPTGSNISTKIVFINVSAPAIPIADFTSVITGSTPPVSVQFNDTSTNSPTQWNWSFGDGNVSALQNPLHVYEFCGNFDVSLRVQNLQGFSWDNKSNYIVISCVVPTPTPTTAQTKIAAKVTDTQNFIYIGVILIIVAGIIVFAGKLFTKK